MEGEKPGRSSSRKKRLSMPNTAALLKHALLYDLNYKINRRFNSKKLRD